MARKPTPRHQTTMRLPPALIEALDKEACRRGMSRSRLTEQVLSRFVTKARREELPEVLS